MSVAANATSASVDLGTNPTPGTYYYRVVAENATGSSQPSNVVNAVIEAPAPDPTATIPNPPVSLKTTGITKDAATGNYYVNLSWTDRSKNERAFEIQSSTSATGEFKTVLVSGASSISNKVSLGTNPAPGTYYYRVVAVNDAGVSQPTNVISVVVESANAVPSAPTNLTTTGTVSVLDNNPAVFLNWNDCSQNEDGFNVYFATLKTGPFTKAGTVGKDRNGAVHILNNKGTYYYKITAYNSVGESTESGITTVVIN
jgi:predicted phage tail protein